MSSPGYLDLRSEQDMQISVRAEASLVVLDRQGHLVFQVTGAPGEVVDFLHGLVKKAEAGIRSQSEQSR